MKAGLPRTSRKCSNAGADGPLRAHPPSSKGKQKYILHDGPPYTSGPSPGTAMTSASRISSSSRKHVGFDAPTFRLGLPRPAIEIKVDKELGARSSRCIRRRCAPSAAGTRRNSSTCSASSSSASCLRSVRQTVRDDDAAIRVGGALHFLSFYENGFVYKGLRAVYWCMHDETRSPKPKSNTRITPAAPSG